MGLYAFFNLIFLSLDVFHLILLPILNKVRPQQADVSRDLSEQGRFFTLLSSTNFYEIFEPEDCKHDNFILPCFSILKIIYRVLNSSFLTGTISSIGLK